MAAPVQITRVARQNYYDALRVVNEAKLARTLPEQLPLPKLSKRLSERVATPPDAPVPECVTCGVCCAYLLLVPVTVADSATLDAYVELTLDDAPGEIAVERLLPRDAASGHCANLGGTLGREVGCTIYEKRPAVCRDFDAGSDRCHEYRRIYGLEPQLNPFELITAIDRIEQIERPECITEARILEESRSAVCSINADGSVETHESIRLKIVVFVGDDGRPHEIHSYDASEELWLESDFLTLSVKEAADLIANRKNEGSVEYV